ncbi:MAG: MAPEG family protein [Alphaproteobacteria bacterium GM202ARS2]|nr:MAPEG family protein [Alphaproteobacteria bacterium GM202ARS2]
MLTLTTPITLLYAGMLGIVYGILVQRILVKRRQYRVSRYDGNVPELGARIRAHSNFAEYVPLLLLFLLLFELNNLPPLLLHAFGLLLVLARIYHAYGLITAESTQSKNYRPRQRATFITMTLLISASLFALIAALTAHTLAWL